MKSYLSHHISYSWMDFVDIVESGHYSMQLSNLQHIFLIKSQFKIIEAKFT